MNLEITHGAYGFFPEHSRRTVAVSSAEELAEVYRKRDALFNASREPWGLRAYNPATGKTAYVWHTEPEHVERSWNLVSR